MNTAQQNRLLMIVERARRFNNYADCDVIEEAVRQVENATGQAEALEAIEYVLVAVDFRRGTVAFESGEQACEEIKLLKYEFLAYESILSAQHYKLQSAKEYFKREAKNGAVIRIV